MNDNSISSNTLLLRFQIIRGINIKWGTLYLKRKKKIGQKKKVIYHFVKIWVAQQQQQKSEQNNWSSYISIIISYSLTLKLLQPIDIAI